MADEAQDRKTPDTERAEGEEPQGTELREYSEDQLREILDAHERWVESAHKQGKRANLRKANLPAAYLGGANLQEASLGQANLRKADLTEANLQKANLRGANLQEASLGQADLRKADLTEANLQKANLQEAHLLQANLKLADLALANLQEANLWGASLQGANLWGASLQGANLYKANLQEANLVEANLQKANLTNVQNLWTAKLRHANLEVIGLLGNEFAQADVTGATLPKDIHDFPILKVIDETSKNARKIFVAMLLGCVYSWLTIATRAAGGETDATPLDLPIIGTKVPITWFYVVAPLVLLAVFFYLHFYLRRLWEGLAELPAIFPDGKRLDQRAYPWLLTGLVRRHFKKLQKTKELTSHLEECFTILLAWWTVPITSVGFWWFCLHLKGHTWTVTLIHVALITVSIISMLQFLRSTKRILRRHKVRPATAHWLERKAWRTGWRMVKEGFRSGFYRPAADEDQAESTTSGRVRNAVRWLHERAILDSLLVVSLLVFLVWYSHGVIGWGVRENLSSF